MNKDKYKVWYAAPMRRKMAVLQWRTLSEATTHKLFDVDMSMALNFLKNYQESTGAKVTTLHLIGKALGKCIELQPEINTFVKNSNIYIRKDIDLSILVNIPAPNVESSFENDLLAMSIPYTKDMTIKDIYDKITLKASLLRKKDFSKSLHMRLLKSLYFWPVKCILKLPPSLICRLLSCMGMSDSYSGSVLITSIGCLDDDSISFVPFTFFAQYSLVTLIGKINKKPVVVNDEIVIRPIMPIVISYDHRLMDGFQVSKMIKNLKKFMETPEKLLEEINQ